MKFNLILLVLVLLGANDALSQIDNSKSNYFAKTFEVGTSLTYIWNPYITES